MYKKGHIPWNKSKENAIDMTGKKFGRLTVIKRAYPNDPKKKKGRCAYWLCKCKCGVVKVVRGDRLRNGNTKSCGCLCREIARKRKVIDLTGQKFGRLTVIGRDYSEPRSKKYVIKWLCKCECGKEKIIRGQNLRHGDTKSCGCLNKEILKNNKNRRLNFGVSNMRILFRRYKNHAKERKLKFSLTEEQFIEITKKNCHYCGEKPNGIVKDNETYGNYIYNGIDRVNNDKGYTIENSVPCCKICNFRKSAMTLQEFKSWIEKVYNKMFIKEGEINSNVI